ncbi:MAG: DUF6226 family protein [Mycobacteriales bacterium]
MGDRWGMDGPPQDAYSRVTDPGRYAPLHGIARTLLDRLENSYDVTRETAVAVDPTGAPAQAITLAVADGLRSPFGIVFTSFPGLLVRTGRDSETPVPQCGCDACDETVDESTERLEALAAAVIGGTLGERLVQDREWWHEHWFEAAGQQWGGRQRVESDALRALREALPRGELIWMPWARRNA